MINRTIEVDDVLYDPRSEKIVQVLGFAKDQFGQNGVVYTDDGTTQYITTGWFVFLHFTFLGRL
jgi:hypothetical protein